MTWSCLPSCDRQLGHRLHPWARCSRRGSGGGVGGRPRRHQHTTELTLWKRPRTGHVVPPPRAALKGPQARFRSWTFTLGQFYEKKTKNEEKHHTIEMFRNWQKHKRLPKCMFGIFFSYCRFPSCQTSPGSNHVFLPKISSTLVWGRWILGSSESQIPVMLLNYQLLRD